MFKFKKESDAEPNSGNNNFKIILCENVETQLNLRTWSETREPSQPIERFTDLSNPGRAVVSLHECTIQTKFECVKKPLRIAEEHVKQMTMQCNDAPAPKIGISNHTILYSVHNSVGGVVVD